MVSKLRKFRKAEWIALLIAVAVILQVPNQPVTHAIPIRQDPNMSVKEGIVTGISNITNVLKELSSQLNDTTIKRYQEEMLDNASSGNYAGVNELLNEVRTYLKVNYMNKSITEEEASEISLITSTNGVDSGVISVNMSEALKTYAELMKNKELLKIIEKLSQEGSNSLTSEESETLLQALTKIVSIIRRSPSKPGTLPQPPKSLSPQGGLNITGLQKIPSLPKSLPKPSISSVQTHALKLFALVLLTLTIISAAIYATLKARPGITYSVREYMVKTLTRLSIRSRKINDPIIKAYALILKQLELLGIKKLSNETPREFLKRVKSGKYFEVLKELTPAYEIKAYSRKQLREEVVKELIQLVRKVIGPVRIRT